MKTRPGKLYFSDMKTSQRYLSSVNKGNIEVLDLPAGDVEHLLAKFFSSG